MLGERPNDLKTLDHWCLLHLINIFLNCEYKCWLIKNVLVNFLKKKMTLLASIAGIVPENATFKLHDVRQSPFKMCWSKLTIVWIINKFLKIAYKLSFTNLFTNHKLILYYSCKIILLHLLQCKFGLWRTTSSPLLQWLTYKKKWKSRIFRV